MSISSSVNSTQDISRDIHEKDQSTYNAQSEILYKEVLSLPTFENVSTSSTPEDSKPIMITKNDNIKARVTKILNRLEHNQQVMLVAKSNGIPKLISIVEIAKNANDSKDGGKERKVSQFNRMTKFKSYTNPNYAYAKSTARQRGNIERAINDDDDDDEDDEAAHAHKRDWKIFELPILNVLLVTGDESDKIGALDLPSWTYQG